MTRNVSKVRRVCSLEMLQDTVPPCKENVVLFWMSASELNPWISDTIKPVCSPCAYNALNIYWERFFRCTLS
jgi:hypothetical protein